MDDALILTTAGWVRASAKLAGGGVTLDECAAAAARVRAAGLEACECLALDAEPQPLARVIAPWYQVLAARFRAAARALRCLR